MKVQFDCDGIISHLSYQND